MGPVNGVILIGCLVVKLIYVSTLIRPFPVVVQLCVEVIPFKSCSCSLF